MNDSKIQNRLTVLETIIEQGQQTFIEVGVALIEIREKRLYKENFATFEGYCQTRWGWTRQRAYQLIESANVVSEMSTIVDISPKVQNEGQARELAKIKNPQVRAQVWQKVNQMAQEVETVVTAKLVKDAVEVQKQIELQTSGNGFALPENFKTKAQVAKEFANEPDSRWLAVINNLEIHLTSIKKLGDAKLYAKDWSVKKQTYYFERIKEIRQQFQTVENQLKELLNADTE